MSPQIAGQVGGAIAGVGQQIAKTGDYAGRVAEQIRRAERTIRATSIENEMRNDLENSAQALSNRTDWGSFEGEAQTNIENLRQKYTEAAGSDPHLLTSVNQAFDVKSGEYLRAVRSKALVEMTKQGKGELEKTYNSSVQDAASDISEKNVAKERAKMAETINLYVEHGIITAKEGVIKLEKFDRDVETTRARREIFLNPEAAADKLADPANYPNMDEDIRIKLLDQATRRADAVKKAAEIRQKEIEKTEKAVIKKAHDDEERKIGDLYMKGEFTSAFMLAQDSELLTGDEKKTWADAIEKKSKTFDVSGEVVAKEIVKINGMIANEEDPEKIKSYVTRTPNLNKEDKEQYLNKLEQKLSGTEKEGRRLGYGDIEDIIIPKRGALAPLLRTAKETERVMKAQVALDEWLDLQKQTKKYPTASQIRLQAQYIAGQYQLSIPEKIAEIEAEAKKTAVGVREAQEQKAEYNKIPKADRTRIEGELENSGYPTTKTNVISIYKKKYSQVK